MLTINGYHAHVYFDSNSVDMAKALCLEAGRKFGIPVGHFHLNPVGPHPCGSCQLSITPQLFGQVVPWLALNRDGLTIFLHLTTGDDYKDHTDHTIWMGEMMQLNLAMFKNH